MSEEPQQKVKDLSIGTYNLANSTKWIFNIPIGHLFNIRNDYIRDGQLLEYPLNCKSIAFPEFKMGSTNVAFLNYGIELSNHSNITEKQLTITFLISENWLQYLMLLKWFELEDFTRFNEDRSDTITVDIGYGAQGTIAKTDWEKQQYGNGTNPYYSAQGPIVDCNLYLMDNFMNRKCTFNFEGCWIKGIRNVELDYSKIEGTEMTCTFTLAYYKYNIINNDLENSAFFPDGIYQDEHDKMIQKDKDTIAAAAAENDASDDTENDVDDESSGN